MTSCKSTIRFSSIFCFLFITLSFIQAQERSSGRRHHKDSSDAAPRPRLRLNGEIGINATSLVDKVFRASPDSANLNPYLLTARLSYKGFGLHIGGGGDYQVTEAFQTGYRDSDTRTRKSWEARVGIDYRTKLARRWTATFALDGVGNYSLDKRLTDSGFDAIEQIEQFSGWGGGLSVGLAYWINAHIGLMTEANFYYIAGTA